MTRILPLLFSLLLLSVSGFAQRKETDPAYEKHYADVAPIETDEIRIEVIRPHSQQAFSQIALKITNKTDDYIVVKKHAITFRSAENGYGDKHPKEDIDLVEPKGEITRSIKVEGGIGFRVDKLEVLFDGAFSRAAPNGTPTGGGEFKMKPDNNSIMMGQFAITLKKWKFDAREVTADFKVRYRGEGVGLVSEELLKIRKEDGTFLKNTEAKAKPFVMAPMATRTVTVVRPFAKDEVGKNGSIFIVWDEALQESLGTPFQVPGLSFQYDAEKTKAENK